MVSRRARNARATSSKPRQLRSPLYLVAVLFFSATVAASDFDPLALGRDLTARFYAGEVSDAWQNMTPAMHDGLQSENALRAFSIETHSQLGDEVQVIDERVEDSPGYRVYVRIARFSKFEQAIVVTWAFDTAGQIAGFYIRPQPVAADSPYLDYETKAELRLPFDGEWYVFWGGRKLSQNYHVVAEDQRFAYDFVIVRDGTSHSGDGTSNDQYYCWNLPILAPANGTVSAIIDGLPDNNPSVMDPANPAGNHVFIDFGNEEFGLFAHLQKGSVTVAVGDPVLAGDELGRCGNSGNTSEPHLHFHLQDAPGFGRGRGKPALFNDYIADGKSVTRGEPVRGQTISYSD